MKANRPAQTGRFCYNDGMKKKEKLIVGNWKLNPTDKETAKKIFVGVRQSSTKSKYSKTVICPPFHYLSVLQPLIKGKKIALGAQDVFWENEGAFTGEISPVMLSKAGASYVIIGHSERRAMGETDEMVNRKVKAALKEGLRAIVCVGEKERDVHGHYLEFLSAQIRNSLDKIQKKSLSEIVIAYEPVWAIGKKEALNGSLLYEMTLFVKKVISDIYGYDAGMNMSVLYGGSVTPANTEDIISNGQVDGLLIGRQSLDPESFNEIITLIDQL